MIKRFLFHVRLVICAYKLLHTQELLEQLIRKSQHEINGIEQAFKLSAEIKEMAVKRSGRKLIWPDKNIKSLYSDNDSITIVFNRPG